MKTNQIPSSKCTFFFFFFFLAMCLLDAIVVHSEHEYSTLDAILNRNQSSDL
jgi:hypothetical protein